MMSLINTNYNYLKTMGIEEESPLVGVIVAVYYLGCTVGAILASWLSNSHGRKLSIIICLLTASLGNLLMFVAGINGTTHGREVMLAGRVVMGLGVGGIDAVVPVYSSELSSDDSRGTALAQEFQANIFGLNMAFIINLALTQTLGKYNEWAWRSPIIIMQIYPAIMMAVTNLLPETPRWYVLHEQPEKAEKSIAKVWGKDSVDDKIKDLKEAHKKEQEDGAMLTYADLCLPGRSQFHPTVITVMGQVNQALTGYGAVSVYGPQIFELLGFATTDAELLTMGNYIFYFGMMTFAWMLIDKKGRRWLLVTGSFWLAVSFALLTLLGGLASNGSTLGIPLLATGIPGITILYFATAAFGTYPVTSPCPFRPPHTHQLITQPRYRLAHPTFPHSHRNLPILLPRSRLRHLSHHLGPRQLHHHFAHTNRLQQPEILPLSGLRRHQYFCRLVDLHLPPGIW